MRCTRSERPLTPANTGHAVRKYAERPFRISQIIENEKLICGLLFFECKHFDSGEFPLGKNRLTPRRKLRRNLVCQSTLHGEVSERNLHRKISWKPRAIAFEDTLSTRFYTTNCEEFETALAACRLHYCKKRKSS